MKRFGHVQIVLFMIMGIYFCLPHVAFGQAVKDGFLTLYDYGSLDGVVDEKNFKAKLGQWVATYNKIKRDVLAMPRAKAESAVLLGAVRENCCDLDGLDTVVRPVLDHWSEVGDLDALSENERRVIFLLEEYGIKLASAEGYGFLVVNWNYLNTLLLPNPSPEAQSYMTVKANQPDYFFSDGAVSTLLKKWAAGPLSGSSS